MYFLSIALYILQSARSQVNETILNRKVVIHFINNSRQSIFFLAFFPARSFKLLENLTRFYFVVEYLIVFYGKLYVL